MDVDDDDPVIDNNIYLFDRIIMNTRRFISEHCFLDFLQSHIIVFLSFHGARLFSIGMQIMKLCILTNMTNIIQRQAKGASAIYHALEIDEYDEI